LSIWTLFRGCFLAALLRKRRRSQKIAQWPEALLRNYAFS
jgi:hypothetical protein